MNNLAIKLNSLFAGGGGLSRLAEMNGNGDTLQTVNIALDGGLFLSIFQWLGNLILRLLYFICTFVLNLIELLQLAFSLILGISVDINDYAVIDNNNPLVKILTNENVLKVFRFAVGVGIVLVIVFTIFAIIKSEYQNAIGVDEPLRQKGRIAARSLRSIFLMGFFPLMLLVSIILVNAILAGFNNILRGGKNSTIAGQIFITSAYGANNYRKYADGGMRIPVSMNFTDPIGLGNDFGYTTDELLTIYKNYQPTGKELYKQFAYGDFSDFKDTLVYKNNRMYNANEYKGFENFICTPEQYYVMADFIDYAVENNLRYYIKNMSDVDINWKYVDKTIYDEESQSLTINYVDASDINNGVSYQMVYAPTALKATTPIQDAVNTIEAMLGLGNFSDITFNALKRLENSINIVEWETDSVLLKFSDTLGGLLKTFYGDKNTAPRSVSVSAVKNAISSSTSDQIILYELFRKKYNNDLSYSVQDFIEGVTLPVYKIERRPWQASLADYITVEELYAVKINNTYYEVELNENLVDENDVKLRDQFNSPYYTLLPSTEKLQNVTASNERTVDFGTIQNSNGNTLNLGIWENSSITTTNSFADIIITLRGTVRYQAEDGSWVYENYDDKATKVVKQIGWPQKLINDLQVIYKDININQFIATDKWLTELGEYVEAINGDSDFSSNISTSLIHPLGLIMSELFLGELEIADPNDNNLASVTFSSVFDEQTMRALMLSTLGENQYFQVKAQFDYFNEMFNAFMSPILDEIAYYEGFDLVDGRGESVELFTYKAYLASMLISDSAAKWMYNTALSMLGSSEFEEVFFDAANGNYRRYTDRNLPPKYKGENGILMTILKNAKANLASQGVEPGDEAYPEYFEILEAYINDDASAFDNRLEIVLNNYLPRSYRQGDLDEKYEKLLKTYQDLLNSNCTYQDVIESKIPAVDVSGSKNDEYDKCVSESDVQRIREAAYALQDYANKLGSMQSPSVTSIDWANKLANAILNFANAKSDMLKTDMSYTHVGQKEQLKTQLEALLEQAVDAFNALPNKVTRLIDKDFKLERKDLVNIEKLKDWNELKGKYNHLQDFVDGLVDENGEYVSSFKDIDSNKETLDNYYALLKNYVTTIGSYIDMQETIDKLNLYYISFSVSSYGTRNNEALSLQVSVNNHVYTVGRNFSSTRFIEYVLGGKYLKDLGYELAFVEDDYEGLVNADNKDRSFGSLQDFTIQIGQITAVLFQMTNLVKLSPGNYDEITLNSPATKNDASIMQSLPKLMLDTILDGEYLPLDIVKIFFNLGSETPNLADGQSEYQYFVGRAKLKYQSNKSEAERYLETVLEYLLLDQDVSKLGPSGYMGLTLRELRQICLDYLVDYENVDNESLEQNQKRFLAVFAIACGDWTMNKYSGLQSSSYNRWDLTLRDQITGYRIDKQAQAVILRLAGLEDRPYEELVGAEYTIDLNKHDIDENNGDVFIICTFDEEIKQYIPFMMATSRNAGGAGLVRDEEGYTWLSKYNHTLAYTEYYSGAGGNVYYPVVAKGIINSDGKPTAIREVDGKIEFYRKDVVIRNLSKGELSEYFVSMDEVPVHMTGIGYVVDFFMRVFSGGKKSLAQMAVENNPRYYLEANYNFCYGVDETVHDSLVSGFVAQDFNFDTRFSQRMENLYTSADIDMLVLFIGTFSVFIALWKALWGVTARMFDLAVYFMIGPVAISTLSFSHEEYIDKKKKDKGVTESPFGIYASWKESIISKVISVFAYAIGFNIFLLLVPIITKLDLFSTNEAFKNIPLFGKVSVNFINRVARLIFLIVASFLTNTAPRMFAKWTQTGNGFDEGERAYSNAKNAINTVADVWSGKAAVDAVKEAKYAAENITGITAIKGVYDSGRKLAVKGMALYMRMHGVPKEATKAMEQAATESINQERERREQRHEQRTAREVQRGTRTKPVTTKTNKKK